MQLHPEIGAGILEDIDTWEDVRLIVRHHHEHWDGAGYPLGLTVARHPAGSAHRQRRRRLRRHDRGTPVRSAALARERRRRAGRAARPAVRPRRGRRLHRDPGQRPVTTMTWWTPSPSSTSSPAARRCPQQHGAWWSRPFVDRRPAVGRSTGVPRRERPARRGRRRHGRAAPCRRSAPATAQRTATARRAHPPPRRRRRRAARGGHRGRSLASSSRARSGAEVPLGYHRLDGARGPSTPGGQPAALPPARRAAPRRLGGAAVRRRGRSRSWGIGDLADLRAFGEWASAAGDGFALLSPLNAAAPSPPDRGQPLPAHQPALAQPAPPARRGCARRRGARRRPGADRARRSRAQRRPHRRPRRRGDHQARRPHPHRRGEPARGRRSRAGVAPRASRWRGSPPSRSSPSSTAATSGSGPRSCATPPAAAVRALARRSRARVTFHAWLQWLIERQLAGAPRAHPADDRPAHRRRPRRCRRLGRPRAVRHRLLGRRAARPLQHRRPGLGAAAVEPLARCAPAATSRSSTSSARGLRPRHGPAHRPRHGPVPPLLDPARRQPRGRASSCATRPTTCSTSSRWRACARGRWWSARTSAPSSRWSASRWPRATSSPTGCSGSRTTSRRGSPSGR